MFVSIYYIDLVCLLVLVEWPYVIDVLWGPVVESPSSPEPGAPGKSIVYLLWGLIAVGISRKELTFRLTGCEKWP